jgi:hypothetical protein
VGLRDRDALLLTLGLGLAVGVSMRWPRLGAVALAILFVDVAAWMGLALWSHVGHDDPVASIVVSGLLTYSAVVGLVALAVQLRRGEERAHAGRRPFLAAALGLAWGVTATGVVAAAPSMVDVPEGGEGRLVVSMRNSRFSTERLETEPGWVTVVVANPDLFWHTFTVPDLDFDIALPVGTVREASLHLRPGRYEYVCRVPGHSRMVGVLVVA